MFISTRAISLNTIKLSDKKFIATIYTEYYGLQSCLVYENTRVNNYLRIFNQFAILDIVIFHKPNKTLQQIKEVSINFIPQTIPFDIRKITLSTFIKEIIIASIKEQEQNNELFNFLDNTILNLDNKTTGLAFFHLQFMTNFLSYLGCKPIDNYSKIYKYFDMLEGHFTDKKPSHPYVIEPPQTAVLHNLLNNDDEYNLNNLKNKMIRDNMLQLLLEYYKIHLPGMGNINSHKILKEVLD